MRLKISLISHTVSPSKTGLLTPCGKGLFYLLSTQLVDLDFQGSKNPLLHSFPFIAQHPRYRALFTVQRAPTTDGHKWDITDRSHAKGGFD